VRVREAAAINVRGVCDQSGNTARVICTRGCGVEVGGRGILRGVRVSTTCVQPWMISAGVCVSEGERETVGERRERESEWEGEKREREQRERAREVVGAVVVVGVFVWWWWLVCVCVCVCV
jgi:hypothetical protein